MKIFEPTNSANLERSILWQYERAERLKSLIGFQQSFFDGAVTAFWNSFRDDIFPIVSWNRVSVQFCQDTGFNGEYVKNSTTGIWEKGIYFIYQEDGDWYMTDRTIVYFSVGDGSSHPPSNWERIA